MTDGLYYSVGDLRRVIGGAVESIDAHDAFHFVVVLGVVLECDPDGPAERRPSSFLELAGDKTPDSLPCWLEAARALRDAADRIERHHAEQLATLTLAGEATT